MLLQDPTGAYIRRWVPELANLSSAYIHTPWMAPAAELETAGVVLGQTYPHRCVRGPFQSMVWFMDS